MSTSTPLRNLVHLAIGLAGLYGLLAAGNSDINFLSLNGADNILHLVSAAAGVAIALWPAQRTVRADTADRSTGSWVGTTASGLATTSGLPAHGAIMLPTGRPERLDWDPQHADIRLTIQIRRSSEIRLCE